MAQKYINARADISVTVYFVDSEGHAISIPSCDWSVRLFTTGEQLYTMTHKDGVLVGCVKVNDYSIVAHLPAETIGAGQLKIRRDIKFSDSEFSDGDREECDVEKTDYIIVSERRLAQLTARTTYRQSGDEVADAVTKRAAGVIITQEVDYYLATEGGDLVTTEDGSLINLNITFVNS